MIVRHLTDADHAAAWELNAAEVPKLGAIDPAGFDALLAQSALALVAERDGEFLGFVVALRPGAGYSSENYRWFSEHYDDFVYVDRIGVRDAARGSGVGRALYDAVVAFAREVGAPRVTCEYNVDPPNPGSAKFHAAYGFREVGRLDTKGNTIRVSLQEFVVPAIGG